MSMYPGQIVLAAGTPRHPWIGQWITLLSCVLHFLDAQDVSARDGRYRSNAAVLRLAFQLLMNAYGTVRFRSGGAWCWITSRLKKYMRVGDALLMAVDSHPGNKPSYEACY